MPILVLSQADIHAALDPATCEQAMADVLIARARDAAANPLRSVWVPAGAPGAMGLMPAYRPGTFSLKALCLIPDNPARGLDTHQGTVTVFRGETGRPVAVLNASAITEIRTAAVTAVATRALARADARVLAIIGAGVQARSHLTALASVRPWDEVRVYAPTAAHAQAVADAADGGGIRVAGDARQAVEGADVVVTVTSAREPVFEHAWLKPGVHVNAVGASIPSHREIPVETVAAATLFCDSRESVRHEAGEFRLAVEQGAIAGEDHIRAELGEVLAGTAAGRTDEGELTVFRSLGIGVEDLAAARVAINAARQRGLGSEVEF
jgi:ornithine cyclodeaminase/alanine dehydrogenase-like protein (mu-crystallin family)